MAKDTIMIQWKNTLFSEKLYAWFDCENGDPVFATTLEDCLLPENIVIQRHETDDCYMVFAWDNTVEEHLFRGRLFIPSNRPCLTNWKL